jgi:serine/threonine protein kinase
MLLQPDDLLTRGLLPRGFGGIQPGMSTSPYDPYSLGYPSDPPAALVYDAPLSRYADIPQEPPQYRQSYVPAIPRYPANPLQYQESGSPPVDTQTGYLPPQHTQLADPFTASRDWRQQVAPYSFESTFTARAYTGPYHSQPTSWPPPQRYEPIPSPPPVYAYTDAQLSQYQVPLAPRKTVSFDSQPSTVVTYEAPPFIPSNPDIGWLSEQVEDKSGWLLPQEQLDDFRDYEFEEDEFKISRKDEEGYDFSGILIGEEKYILYSGTDEWEEDGEDIKEKRALGAGNFGTARIAQNAETGEWAVVKVINITKLAKDMFLQHCGGSQSRAEQFTRDLIENEQEVLERLGYNLGTMERENSNGDTKYYMLQPKIGDQTLSDTIDDDLEIEEAFTIATTALENLEWVHDHNVIHHDIQPGNIRLCRDGDGNITEAKLIDFGLAVALDEDEDHCPTSEHRGHADYGAPEALVSGRYSSKKSDVYSMGKTLEKLGMVEKLKDSGCGQAEELSRWLKYLLILMHDEKPENRPSAEECRVYIQTLQNISLYEDPDAELDGYDYSEDIENIQKLYNKLNSAGLPYNNKTDLPVLTADGDDIDLPPRKKHLAQPDLEQMKLDHLFGMGPPPPTMLGGQFGGGFRGSPQPGWGPMQPGPHQMPPQGPGFGGPFGRPS